MTGAKRITGAVAATMTAAAAMAALVTAAGSASATATWSDVSRDQGLATSPAATQTTSPTGITRIVGTWYGQLGISPVTTTGATGGVSLLPYTSYGYAKTLGTVGYLADGRPVVSWTPSNGGSFVAVLQPDGTFGPATSVPGLSSFGVAGSTVVAVASGAASGFYENDFSVDATGKLTATTTSATPLFTGSPLFGQSWTAVDANGVGDVLFPDAGTNGAIVDAHRTAAGTWTTSELPSSGGSNNVYAAVAPGGRAIVSWTVATADAAGHQYAKTDEHVAIRLSGSTFGTPVTIASDHAPGFSAVDRVHVAAGGDGTLAVADNVLRQAFGSSDCASETDTVRIAPPGQGLSGAITIPDNAANCGSSLGVLGAGDGRAAVDTTSLIDTNVQQTSPYGYDGALTVSVAVLDAKGNKLAAHTFATVSGHFDQSNRMPTAYLSGLSVDTVGDVLATGILTPNDTYTDYGTYWDPTVAPNPYPSTASPSPGCASPTTARPSVNQPMVTSTCSPSASPTTEPTTSAPAPTTAPTATTLAPAPSPTFSLGGGGIVSSATIAPPVPTAAAPKLAKVKANARTGGLSFTVTVPKGGTGVVTEKVSLQLLVKTTVKVKGKKVVKTTTITLASKTVRLKPGQTVSITLAPNANGLKQLRAHPHDAVVLTTVTSRPAYRSRTTTTTVHLQVPKVKK